MNHHHHIAICNSHNWEKYIQNNASYSKNALIANELKSRKVNNLKLNTVAKWYFIHEIKSDSTKVKEKETKMSHKTSEKASTSSSIVACCQSTTTTPDNSIVDYIEEDIEAPNNNTLYHASDDTMKNLQDHIGKEIIGIQKTIDFKFPKRPKIDIEFQDVKYSVKQFSFKNRHIGESAISHSIFIIFMEITAIKF